MEAVVKFQNQSGTDLDLKVTENGRDFYCLTIGRNTYISGISIDSGAARSHITIGRYTSISKRVVVEIGLNHDHHLVSNFPFRDFDSSIDPSHEDINHYFENNRYHLFIGNDVWIGEGVRMLGGIHIGDGAVIGMGAVVTKDIPPYAVAVGNPARVIKYRFDEDTISKLLQIRWWNWDDQTIQARIHDIENPNDFVNKYFQKPEKMPVSEFTDLMDRMKENGGKIFYFVFDCNAPQPLWDKVLFSFRKSYKKNQNQLLIVDIASTVRTSISYKGVEKVLNEFVSGCDGIITVFDDREVFYHANIYIAGNDVRSLSFIDMASARDIEIRSACDWQSGLFDNLKYDDFLSNKDELKVLENEVYVGQKYEYYKILIINAINEKKYEHAMSVISACCNMLYMWNQSYTDDFLEDSIANIAEALTTDEIRTLEVTDDGPVLFYDNFGLDLRGLALIYVKALAASGRKFIYLTIESADGKQPEIDKVIEGCPKAVKMYFSGANSSLNKLNRLQQIFATEKPYHAFLYTTPDDTAGVAAFMQMDGKVKRYQINLTDHAFWLGRNAFDFCLEFRNYGASISAKYRKIPTNKLVLLPYYPVIVKDAAFNGFPFDSTGKKIIFSGGSIYKTIDKDLTYYQIVFDILKENEDTIFLYAGEGDDTYLKRIEAVFPGRAYHIAERPDLYQVLKHSTIYLNTYPLPGGLMTQYAAVSGRIPITLCNKNKSFNGLLLDQDNRKIQYINSSELVKDVNRLLRDSEYRKEREKLLDGSVISEEKFNTELNKQLSEGKTDFPVVLSDIDTSEFQSTYRLRFDRTI